MSNLTLEISSSEESDKRYFPRWEVEDPVQYTIKGNDKSFLGKTKDISCAGACILVDEYIEPDQKINMTMQLSSGVKVDLNARILWVRSENGQLEMGGTFYDTPDEVQDTILQYAFKLDKDKVIKQWFKGWDG